MMDYHALKARLADLKAAEMAAKHRGDARAAERVSLHCVYLSITGKFICALKHICALKNIFVHWKFICALKNTFVH